MANDPSPAKKPLLSSPRLTDSAKKNELERLRLFRDDVSLRIEMALMSGMARLIDQHSGDAWPPFLHLLLRDLSLLNQLAPREAEQLRERLAQGIQSTELSDSLDRTLMGTPNQLSFLAVR
jgi:hypothetical protein